jgi:hypothetical protein
MGHHDADADVVDDGGGENIAGDIECIGRGEFFHRLFGPS